MIALTARLNERDETIVALQDELDAWARVHRDCEDSLDRKSSRVLLLERLLAEHTIPIPRNNFSEQSFEPLQILEPNNSK